jgi:hypothetical protein
MKKLAFLSVLFLCLFTACDKVNDDEPCTTKYIAVESNSPVIEGWPIYLSSAASSTGSFKWIGPKGVINSASGFPNYIQVLNSTYQDSGSYRLEITNGYGCLEYRNFTNIKVIPPPPPPCNVPANTSTSNIIGLGNETYINVSFTNNKADAYPFSGSSDKSIHFRFYGNQPPKPGKYKTLQSTLGVVDKENQVGIWISTFPLNEYVCKEFQDVYVNKVNGKLQISFCNADFTNPIGSTAIKISSRIVQP